MMQDKTELIDQLKRHEGLSLQAYRCPAGKWTIGYGHRLDAPNDRPSILFCTADQAETWLDRDVDNADRLVKVNLPWASKLAPARYAVLVNMAFNLGMSGLLGFKRMLTALKRGDYAGAAAEMLDSDWHTQVGRRADELAEQMERGTW